ncbi:MAG: RNA polymerase factor sigma-54, partial [Isosphaeraceae bacterium]
MVMLQHKLNVKLSQRQILTPGLVQMVSVLALNKIELKDMINSEMVENPVLEELEDSVPLIDEVGRREEERDRLASVTSAEEPPIPAEEKKDPFDEIDFGSFFQEYLDPGYRSQGEMEDIERPSFENFLSKPTTLTDHLMWQLGALSVSRAVQEAGELIIGNLNEDGYLIASDDELMGVAAPAAPEADAAVQKNLMQEAEALGLAATVEGEEQPLPDDFPAAWDESPNSLTELSGVSTAAAVAPAQEPALEVASTPVLPVQRPPRPVYQPTFTLGELHEALELVRQLDPPGVACRDLRECLLYQLRYIQQQHAQQKNGNGTAQVLTDALAIVDQHLRAVQMKQHKEIAKAIGRPLEAIPAALEFIKTLDPRPGLRYNKSTTRLIEPDVAFIKHGDEWLCLMNDDDVPQL